MIVPWAMCCCIPDDVVNACNLTGCDQESTDGTGMNLHSNPYGGTSTLSTDADVGRAAPGWKLAATQSGSEGTYSVIIFDDPIDQPFCALDDSTICGEFLHRPSGTSLVVWPCAVQSGSVFVLDASGYTLVSSTSAWNRVTGTFRPNDSFFEVTAYGDSGITTGSEIDTSEGADPIYLGFLVQSRGTDGVEYVSYLDNVCVKLNVQCEAAPCIVCYDEITLNSTDDIVSSAGESDGCECVVEIINTFFADGFTLTRSGAPGSMVWGFRALPVSGCGRSGPMDLILSCADGVLSLDMAFETTSGGFAAALTLHWEFDPISDCTAPFSPSSISNPQESNCGLVLKVCCPILNDPVRLVVTPS